MKRFEGKKERNVFKDEEETVQEKKNPLIVRLDRDFCGKN